MIRSFQTYHNETSSLRLFIFCFFSFVGTTPATVGGTVGRSPAILPIKTWGERLPRHEKNFAGLPRTATPPFITHVPRHAVVLSTACMFRDMHSADSARMTRSGLSGASRLPSRCLKTLKLGRPN
ncbi:hypothetical protein B0T14DRAFT_525559, partial [Immersiella caudata]